MPDPIVYGTDSSDRPILMTTYMRDWWLGVVDRLGFEPTIVQGAWMRQAGGGAKASAGYHDLGGCLDLRVWNLTSAQMSRTVRELRRSAAAAWIRDQRHGMDPHIHLVLGTDTELADGAAWQWMQYLAGRDGLSSGGRDYHWRPDPIVTEPPEDDMPSAQEIADAVWNHDLTRAADPDRTMRAGKMLAQTHERARDVKRLVADLAAAEPEVLGRRDVRLAVERALRKVLAEHDDTDQEPSPS